VRLCTLHEWRYSVEVRALDLQSTGPWFSAYLLRCQVCSVQTDHARVPLSHSIVIWYLLKDGDAAKLGRLPLVCGLKALCFLQSVWHFYLYTVQECRGHQYRQQGSDSSELCVDRSAYWQ